LFGHEAERYVYEICLEQEEICLELENMCLEQEKICHEQEMIYLEQEEICPEQEGAEFSFCWMIHSVLERFQADSWKECYLRRPNCLLSSFPQKHLEVQTFYRLQNLGV
jgi:hypothetical protein